MIDLNTRVHLFSGHIDLPNDYSVPEWSGTMADFWHENEGAYHRFEHFQTQLAYGCMHLGGGAEPEFTLCTDEYLDAPVASRR
jgi:hypothetical protein